MTKTGIHEFIKSCKFKWYEYMSNLGQNILDINEEVRLLRSFVIGLTGKDKEGQYRPEFVERVFQALKQKPVLNYNNPKDFLKQLNNIT